MAVKITKFIMSAEYGTPIRSRTATKGLSNTPASEIGNNADKTTIVPTKDDQSPQSSSNGLRYHFSGFAVSPAAMPINSVPEKQN